MYSMLVLARSARRGSSFTPSYFASFFWQQCTKVHCSQLGDWVEHRRSELQHLAVGIPESVAAGLSGEAYFDIQLGGKGTMTMIHKAITVVQIEKSCK